MANFECPNCGNIVPASDKCCKYCGTANPNYVAPVKSQSFLSGLSNTLNSTVNKPSEHSNSSSSVSNKPKKKFSVGIFILLLIIFWPAAIIYLLVTTVV